MAYSLVVRWYIGLVMFIVTRIRVDWQSKGIMLDHIWFRLLIITWTSWFTIASNKLIQFSQSIQMPCSNDLLFVGRVNIYGDLSNSSISNGMKQNNFWTHWESFSRLMKAVNIKWEGTGMSTRDLINWGRHPSTYNVIRNCFASGKESNYFVLCLYRGKYVFAQRTWKRWRSFRETTHL